MSRALVAAAVALLTAACGGSYCPNIAVPSGVSFEIDSWKETHVKTTEATACVESTCRTVTLGGSTRLFVEHTFRSTNSVRVTLRLLDQQRVLFDAGASVHPVRVNGINRNCRDTTWQVRVAPTSQGTLEVAPG